MAIHFIHAGGYDAGSMMYTSAKDRSEVMVGIIHDPSDGYRLSYDKEQIKEQVPLKDFIERLVRVEDSDKEFNLIQSKVQRDIYAIHEALQTRDSQKIRNFAEWLDERYARAIREKKLILMQHNYSVNVKHAAVRTERETISNSERTVLQVGWDTEKVIKHMDEQGLMVQQNPMTPDEAFRVSDDEVYYSMTP